MLKSKLSQPALSVLYQRLLNAYGPQHWWPAETRFEVIIGAILTQNTTWNNVERAIHNLKKENVLTPEKLNNLDDDLLAAMIRPSGYFNQKAKKIKSFLEYYNNRYDNKIRLMAKKTLETLREELLEIYGIGLETADSILLYALEKPVFVIDTYTQRIFIRIGYFDKKLHYNFLQEWIEERLPADIQVYNEYHALLVHHGKYFCKVKPFCELCTVRKLCEYFTNRSFDSI